MTDDSAALAPLTLKQRRALNVHSLSADLVLFGDDDLDGVLSAHGLTMEELGAMLDPQSGNKALRAQIARLRKQADADPKFMIRLRAATALEGHIATLNQMAADGTAETKDRAAVIKLLAELADAMPKQDKAQANAGVVLQLNLGAALTTASASEALPQPVNRVIEHHG